MHNMNRMSLTLPALTRPSPLPIITKNSDTPPTPPTAYDKESDIHDHIVVHLVLPDGVIHKFSVTVGETVQMIKRRLEDVHGIPYSDVTLCFNGKCLIDPLSLNDFPELLGKWNVSLDVKISPGKPIVKEQTVPISSANMNGATLPTLEPSPLTQETIQHTQQHMQEPTQHIQETSKGAFLDINSTNEVYDSNPIGSISYVEYVDGPISSTSYNTTPSNIGNASSVPSSPPPLPNSFLDSPSLIKNRRKTEETKMGSTTIDVKDQDDDSQCKQIHELGKHDQKRWKLCFLF